MRVPINLASEPFRRDRAILVGSAAVGVMLTVLLAGLIYLAVFEKDQLSDLTAYLARLEQQNRELGRTQAQLEAELRQPENAMVVQQSVFFNELLRRKGISWTKLFTDLEQIMPPDVRLISIRPQVSGTDQVSLDMQVGAQKGESLAALLVKLEQSPLFGETRLITSLPPSQTEPLMRFRITVNYAQKL